MSSLPNIDEPLYEDDNLIFMSDNDEASDSSGTVDDDLLSLRSDESDNDGSQSPILHAIDDLEEAARDIADLDGAHHNDLDLPQQEEDNEEFSIDYSSDEMDDEEELDPEDTSDEEEVHQGIQDLEELEPRRRG